MKVLKSLNKKKREKILVRVSEDELANIKANADRHAKGNVSEWLRYTGIHHVPDKNEVE